MCHPKAPPSFSFWTVLTWNRLYCIWHARVYGHGKLPSIPSWQKYLEIFWNIFEIVGDLKYTVKCYFCYESLRITAACTKEQDLQMVSGQLVPDCRTCMFVSGRGSGGCFSPRASKTEIQNEIRPLHAKMFTNALKTSKLREKLDYS